MPLSQDLLNRLGPHFGQAPAATYQNTLSAAPADAMELALNASADRVFTKAEEDILALLSDGHSQDTVATTLGITPSQISQYLSKGDFREELARRKSKKLAKYKKLDDGYDAIEETLIDKLKASLAFVSKPLEIAAILTRINAAKRRMSDPSTSSNVPATQIVSIVLPVALTHKFTKNADGHMLAVDDQSLVTIPSSVLAKIGQTVPNQLTHEVQMEK